MKYAVAAVLAAAVSGVHATYGKNVTVVTEVVDSYVTYCPEPTEIVHGDKTITVKVPGTITITDCPCTVTKPVVEETHEVCYDCPEEKPEEPKPEAPKPEEPEAPVETPEVQPPAPTGGVTPTGEPEPVPTAGAAKVASVAGLAGVVGLAAFIL